MSIICRFSFSRISSSFSTPPLLLFFVPVPYRSVYLVAFLVLLARRVVRTSSSVCLFYLVFVCFVILYYYYLLLLPEFRFVLCVFDFFFFVV